MYCLSYNKGLYYTIYRYISYIKVTTIHYSYTILTEYPLKFHNLSPLNGLVRFIVHILFEALS